MVVHFGDKMWALGDISPQFPSMYQLGNRRLHIPA